jgi:hypothetical protein
MAENCEVFYVATEVVNLFSVEILGYLLFGKR